MAQLVDASYVSTKSKEEKLPSNSEQDVSVLPDTSVTCSRSLTEKATVQTDNKTGFISSQNGDDSLTLSSMMEDKLEVTREVATERYISVSISV